MATGYITRHLIEGTTVFREGDRPDGAYVILEGAVRIFTTRDGHQTTLAILKTGEYFGEMSLFDGKARSASAQVAEGSALLRYIGRDEFEAIANDSFVRELLTGMARRLRSADEVITKLESESSHRHDFVTQRAVHRDWVI